MSILIVLVVIGIALYCVGKNQNTADVKANELKQEIARLHEQLGSIQGGSQEQINQLRLAYSALESSHAALNKELEAEKIKNANVLSLKTSSEVRLGQMIERVTPFLESCPYNPRDMHFLGQPVDFIVYSLDEPDPHICLLEVKSGSAQLSPSQKLIKKLVQKGCVRFKELRLNPKGITVKEAEKEEPEEP